MTLSIGIALGPEHAANPRELVACAELAMMTAKARGKSRIVVFHEDESERPDAPTPRSGDVRSIAHLKMLHGVSSKLSRLLEVDEIGDHDRRRAAAADRLPQLSRLPPRRRRPPPGRVPRRPDAGRASSALDVLATKVGVGVTGHVAATGEPFLTGRRRQLRDRPSHRRHGPDRGVAARGAAALRRGTSSACSCISKLGLDQFDADDLRLLEVLAGHASVALVNARLYEAQRREAEGAKALLELSRELSAGTQLDEVVERIARGDSPASSGVPRTSVWLPDGDGDGDSSAAAPGRRRESRRSRAPGDRLPAAAADAFARRSEPFVIARAEYEHLVGDRLRRRARRRVRGRPDRARRRLGRDRARARRRATASTSGSSSCSPAIAGQAKLALDERALVREPRAHVPLDRRGARQCARGEGRVHVVPRPLDHATWR